jgi:LemA protein
MANRPESGQALDAAQENPKNNSIAPDISAHKRDKDWHCARGVVGAREPFSEVVAEANLEYVIVVVALIVVAYGIWIFNRLISDRNLVAQAFADIDVQLKRRADLVPQLVETVKGYAAYERQTLQAVVELRARAGALAEGERRPSASRFGAESELGASLKKLILLQESYPQLKADQNFRDLSAKLVDVEDQLQHARRFYNGAVKQYVTRLQTFPDIIVARLLAFRSAAFFETDDRAAVQVSL